ncbi:DUF3330 domain-containing protein [Stenotrophomonas maltophilia]|uniref:DUF3330 domain-containing protein n=1 Tax=Stenotrophomonas maltophilia TaxID=40324 RepID=UPI0019D43EAC|nr:DUF3330 domain-containing protein [Stenotrophomonas maltophilia]MBN7830507.1 DUF3330 domain-containing protein [Stenotrophomonas maltophilia]MBN7833540.1 DUF3330 domain-containing protein [Stenotrophomonas maltophilia]MBN7859610.1 DUF3330 domain-containing protein [Stenotrophomonas maltophilia]MBN7916380.1 DUF3330 domain-containing protein [Stenotrophomonas maltophilia]MBO2846709.1 DUF3330 domain-containing protein [Stenotrophomonas maltophilia]
MNDATENTTVSCCVCCREIPLTAALTPEGTGYVEHFCGVECLQRFRMRAEGASGADPAQDPRHE